MEYTKLSDHEVEIVTTEEKREVVNLSQLIYDRDSLVRTIELNNQELADRNAACQAMIDEIDKKIKEAKKLGVVEVPITEE